MTRPHHPQVPGKGLIFYLLLALLFVPVAIGRWIVGDGGGEKEE